MSSIKLESNASGTGIFTIASPNSNTNRTLTLPNNTGTILTSATTTGFPAGSVIQVVNATTSSAITTTSTSAVSTGFTATITPTSSSSKIFVLVSLGDVASQNTSGTSINGVKIMLYRGASQIGSPLTSQHSYNSAATSSTGGFTINGLTLTYLDSPATTSSTTYTIYWNVAGANCTGAMFRDGTQGSFTLMEIAA